MAEMPEPEALLEHRAFLRAIAKGLLRDDAAAEDVAQDALLAAMETPPKGRNVRGWLGAVARNLSLMARRGERRRREREMRAARPEAAAPATEALELLELQRKVVDAVRALDEPYRTAIVLHYFHDLPGRELAARLRVPKETARTRLRRGLALLRARLDGEYRGNRSWLPLLVTLAADPRKVSVAGVALMSAKAKVAVAAVLCILLTLGAVKWGGSGGSEPTPRAEASRNAMAPAADSQLPDLPGLPAPVDFAAVDRDRDLHGIVVDRAGAPIAGAVLKAVSYPWRRASVLNHDAWDDAIAGPETRSAADGTFSLRLRPGTDVALRVSADGYAPMELGARQAGERVRVEMDAGARLTVVTRDEQGNPVPGTRLRLWSGGAQMSRGVTDGLGRCALATLPWPGVYLVDVTPARLGYHEWETVHVREPGEREHIVTLLEGRTITGRVVDAETGAGIPNARVGMNWTMTPFVLSDAEGHYELPGWRGKGVSDLHCVADAYGRAQWIVDGDTHDFRLLLGDSVTGRLLGADGRPVTGAPVSTVGSVARRDDQWICTRSDLSDREGRFLLSGLRRDMPHTLIVMAEGHGRYLLDFDPHGDKPGTVDLGDIRLPEARTIAGRVLRSDGQPVARVEVALSGCNDDRTRATKVESQHYGTWESRHTDDLGRFRFTDLSPGTYELVLQQPGAVLRGRNVTLQGSDLLGIELRLPEGREFTVVAVDDAGVPVPSVFVSVASSSGAYGINGTTDASGRATFFVTEGVTRINAYPDASGRELMRADVPVEGDVREFRLVLGTKATITGTVRDEEGRLVADAWVAAKQGDRQISSARAPDGRFSLDAPRGASVDVEFLGLQTERGTIEPGDYVGEPVCAEAGTTDVEIRVRRLPRDRTLRVRVVLPDGTPAAEAFVFVDRACGQTDGNGVAAFTDLLAHESTVSACVQGRQDLLWPIPQRVLPAGQEVTLTLRAARAVSGVVVMEDGSPAPRAVVTVRRGDIAVCSVSTDSEGKFAAPFPADEPGPWVVQAALREKGLKGEVRDVMTGDAAIRIQLK